MKLQANGMQMEKLNTFLKLQTGEDFFMLRHASRQKFIVLLGFDRKRKSGVEWNFSFQKVVLECVELWFGWYWREDTAVIVSVPKLEKQKFMWLQRTIVSK